MPEKKTVRVPRFSTSGTGSEKTSHAEVSMPTAPWEKQGNPKRSAALDALAADDAAAIMEGRKDE